MPDSLSDEEKEIVDRIGIENTDYCVAAIVQKRHPEQEITYIENENAFEACGNRYELNFKIKVSGGDKYQTVCRHVQTLELLFEEI